MTAGAAFSVDGVPGRRLHVNPEPVGGRLADLVVRIQRVAWPLWPEPNPRLLRDLLELCRLQAARGLTVLSWLAAGAAPDDVTWLLAARRLSGARQERMYAAAAAVPGPVHDLVVANWTWVLASPYGGRVTAPYLAGGAYADDGYAAAHATVTLQQFWERHPAARPALAAAWAATRTPADWCTAARMRVAHGTRTPVFAYPRVPLPRLPGLRPWISRLLRWE